MFRRCSIDIVSREEYRSTMLVFQAGDRWRSSRFTRDAAEEFSAHNSPKSLVLLAGHRQVPTDQPSLTHTDVPEVFEEIFMTSVSYVSTGPSDIATYQPHILANFPVGGSDPDFSAADSNRPKICGLPVVGKMLPQCK